MNAIPANGVHAIGDVEFRQVYADCGSATCRACRVSPSHGPYWFASWVEGGEPQQCRIGKYLSVEELRRRLSDDGRLHHRAITDLFRRIDSFEQRGEAEASKRKADEEARRASEWRAHRAADEAFARARAAREREEARAADGPRVTWQSSGASGATRGETPSPGSAAGRGSAPGRGPGPSPGSAGSWRTKGAASGRQSGASQTGRDSSGSWGRGSARGSARPGGTRGVSPNPWAVLGVSSSASGVEIKRAYRTLALRLHPDVGGDVEAMKRLNDAYRSLEELGAVSR